MNKERWLFLPLAKSTPGNSPRGVDIIALIAFLTLAKSAFLFGGGGNGFCQS
jgi:hypothetical protein